MRGAFPALSRPRHAHKSVRMWAQLPGATKARMLAGSRSRYIGSRAVGAASPARIDTVAVEQAPPAPIRHTYPAELNQLMQKQGTANGDIDILVLLYQDGAPGCQEAKQLVRMCPELLYAPKMLNTGQSTTQCRAHVQYIYVY
jgi:hypothetical protein